MFTSPFPAASKKENAPHTAPPRGLSAHSLLSSAGYSIAGHRLSCVHGDSITSCRVRKPHFPVFAVQKQPEAAEA
jgi:hypothetical protein